MIFFDLLTGFHTTVNLCILPLNCALGNPLEVLGSFLGDVQYPEYYSASDRRKLEMCAKFHFHTSTNIEDTQGAEGVAIPPDLYMLKELSPIGLYISQFQTLPPSGRPPAFEHSHCPRVGFFPNFLCPGVRVLNEKCRNFSICFKETGGSLKSRCSCDVSYQFLQKQ